MGNWEKTSDNERLNLVFEHRHKAYGAYQIRQNYERNKMLALGIAATFVCALCGIQYLVSAPVTEARVLHPKPIADTSTVVLFEEEPETQEKTPAAAEKQKPADNNADPELDPAAPGENQFDPKGEGMEGGFEGGLGKGEGGNGIDEYDGKSTGGRKSDSTLVTGPEINSQAYFIGGDLAFANYVRNEFEKLPLAGRMTGAQTVDFLFVVSTGGTITGVTIQNATAVDEEFANAMRGIIAHSPRWVPGVSHGKLVKSLRQVTVKFDLTPF